MPSNAPPVPIFGFRSRENSPLCGSLKRLPISSSVGNAVPGGPRISVCRNQSSRHTRCAVTRAALRPHLSTANGTTECACYILLRPQCPLSLRRKHAPTQEGGHSCPPTLPPAPLSVFAPAKRFPFAEQKATLHF